MIRVSKWSRRVALARTYLDMASICLFRKLQYCMLYCGLLLCSKVTHIIDPHRRNTLRYFPSKRMDFRSSTGRLSRSSLALHSTNTPRKWLSQKKIQQMFKTDILGFVCMVNRTIANESWTTKLRPLWPTAPSAKTIVKTRSR